MSASLFGTADLQSVEVQVEVPSVSLSISPALVQLIQRVVKTFMPQKVGCKRTVCVFVLVRACVHVYMCVHASVCVHPCICLCT